MLLKLIGDGTDSIQMDGTARYGIGYVEHPGVFAWLRLSPESAYTLKEVFRHEALSAGELVLTRQQQREALESLSALQRRLEARRRDRG